MRRLILASLLILIASPCIAGYVDHSSQGTVALTGAISGGPYLLAADGSVWSCTVNGGIETAEDRFRLPVSVSEVRFWNLSSFVTFDDHVWILHSQDNVFEWTDLGRLPVGPISTDQQGVGSMKSRFGTQQSNDQK